MAPGTCHHRCAVAPTSDRSAIHCASDPSTACRIPEPRHRRVCLAGWCTGEDQCGTEPSVAYSDGEPGRGGASAPMQAQEVPTRVGSRQSVDGERRRPAYERLAMSIHRQPQRLSPVARRDGDLNADAIARDQSDDMSFGWRGCCCGGDRHRDDDRHDASNGDPTHGQPPRGTGPRANAEWLPDARQRMQDAARGPGRFFTTEWRTPPNGSRRADLGSLTRDDPQDRSPFVAR
jgi:hypothetical protein